MAAKRKAGQAARRAALHVLLEDGQRDIDTLSKKTGISRATAFRNKKKWEKGKGPERRENMDDLGSKIKGVIGVWKALPHEFIECVLGPMPRRLEMVIASKGNKIDS